jgi:hypothetical protein
MHGAKHAFAQRPPGNHGAMAAHQHHPVLPERPRQRGSLLGRGDQQIGVAELVTAVPEGRFVPHRRADVKHRHDRHAGDTERQDGGRMVVTD